MIGILKVRMRIMGAMSLKEKRKTLKSLKDRMKNMNISIAEVDDQDLWQASTLGLAAVSNEAAHINALLDKVMYSINAHGDVEILDSHIEIMHV